jgi:ubiquinone/menaquinone biosynthesis C-methylase UbiE/NAD-dependent dihydropyrimidine dehydrogenase PreA subunit
MFSYVFMKILEKRPERYDRGIGKHARKVKENIIEKYVSPGMRVLDIGCGTGELLGGAAKAGAYAEGIDVSKKMLVVAEDRFRNDDLQDRVKLHHVPAGVSGMDVLFEDETFDLVTSTLVMSELYPDELRFMLREARRILRKSGTLVLAGEVEPEGKLKRFIYYLLRLPIAIATHLITGTGTRPVSNLRETLSREGFQITDEKRSFLESFIIIAAYKSDKDFPEESDIMLPKTPKNDVSPAKSLWDFVGRWFPNPVEPGLRIIGHPDETSPVFVTCNFHLTVRRVEKALAKENCYLVVAPSNGTNVWCASCGGEMTTYSVVRAIKTSGINERVHHRRLTLPQLSAPGILSELLEKETGWKALFGPVYARDLPSFISNNYKKTTDQCLAEFPLSFRFEMLLSMNFLVWALAGIIILLINPPWFLYISALYWGTGFLFYAGFYIIPGRSGWTKAFILSLIEVAGIALVSVFLLDEPWWTYPGWMAAAIVINAWFAFDIKGIIGGYPSEAVALFNKIGIQSLFGFTFREKGKIRKDDNKCTNCQICIGVCPQGVFDVSGGGKIVSMNNRGNCLACSACISQCREGALSLK